MSAATTLVVEDTEELQLALSAMLERDGHEVQAVSDAETALAKIKERPYDIIILDVRLPGMSGLDALPKLLQIDPRAVVVILTAFGTHDLAIEAIKRGAFDYFTKPFQVEELRIVIRRALEIRRLREEVERLRAQIVGEEPYAGIIGKSAAMGQVFHMLQRVVQTDSTVLLLGESGTGKEVIASAIHHNSHRKDGPFIKLNCVAIPENLLESELFGHERGSFSGAFTQKTGKFELANGGTILLDEIGDMSPMLQAKLLRVLQERQIERVGGTKLIDVDVRIVASTNKNLPEAVREGKFREDLYFRLNVFSITLPPLRDRKEDIPPLVDHLLRRLSNRLNKKLDRVQREVMNHLMAYQWPGNVRELENCLERAAILSDGPIINLEHIPEPIRSEPKDRSGIRMAGAADWVQELSASIAQGGSLDTAMDDIERCMVIDALKRAKGKQADAAKLLNITERSIWHKVKKLSIDVSAIKATLKQS